jgi:hypothetical protein
VRDRIEPHPGLPYGTATLGQAIETLDRIASESRRRCAPRSAVSHNRLVRLDGVLPHGLMEPVANREQASLCEERILPREKDSPDPLRNMGSAINYRAQNRRPSPCGAGWIHACLGCSMGIEEVLVFVEAQSSDGFRYRMAPSLPRVETQQIFRCQDPLPLGRERV